MKNDNKKKRRSDRHEEEQEKQSKLKLLFQKFKRSEAKDDVNETKIYRPSKERSTSEEEKHIPQKRKSRMERHIKEEEITQEAVRTRSERHHPTEVEDMDETANEGEPSIQSVESEASPTKKRFFTIRKISVILGSFILLLLIGYTTLLYGGKMFVDEK